VRVANDGPLSYGFSFMPYDARRAVEAAQMAESSGFSLFGLPDSQVLWAGLYSTLGLCAAKTSTLHIGPHVTNPVTRHWTVTAAEFRALEEFASERTFLGIATGDGAVYGIGKKAAKAATLRETIEQIKTAMPSGVPVQVAAGGPRIAAIAGATGSALILGTGADRQAIDELRRSADDASDSGPVEPWLLMIFNLASTEQGVAQARDEVRASVIAYARHALATRPDSVDLPDRLAEELRSALARYDFKAHARPGDSPNARLGRSLSPGLGAFLEDRFAVIGTPEAAADRLAEIAERTGVRNFWLACNVDQPANVLRIADRMTERA
jgi:alkanesulfonate monooxygenase SsuD/methylene tetrahydromethanopterin reductase-like flavin-dependent oxidoreductase (luciferase family)